MHQCTEHKAPCCLVTLLHRCAVWIRARHDDDDNVGGGGDDDNGGGGGGGGRGGGGGGVRACERASVRACVPEPWS